MAWKQDLEAERRRLLGEVRMYRAALERVSKGFVYPDATETARRLRELQAGLRAAEKRYEDFCVFTLRRDPWPAPVRLEPRPTEAAALAKQRGDQGSSPVLQDRCGMVEVLTPDCRSMISEALQAKRQAEFDAARSRAEIEQLEKRWRREDIAIAAAGDLRQCKVDDLARRVSALESYMGNGLLDVIGECIGITKRDLEKKIHGVERQIPKFHGVWSAGRTYEADSFVVKSGSLWVALEKTSAAPGTPSWCLVTKAGEVR